MMTLRFTRMRGSFDVVMYVGGGCEEFVGWRDENGDDS